MTEGASTVRSELRRTEQEKTREEVARRSPWQSTSEKKTKKTYF
jgi:hypothetical protein